MKNYKHIFLNDIPDSLPYTSKPKRGGLSPFSSTSLVWEDKKWPIKPDVVFEGGNIAKSPDGKIFDNPDDFYLLSTSKNFSKHQFDLINATSSAAAQAAWFAGKLFYQYPDAWPETIRALIIHSANWSDEMIKQFEIDKSKKNEIRKLMRICGYGIPDIKKALHSSENYLTFISQQEIQPFKNDKSTYKMNEMHFYRLPWPKELLIELGEIKVTLRVTLSYFIEPGVGEIGWKDKYRYQSYGLRFDINNAQESEKSFKKRINDMIQDDDENIPTVSSGVNWLIGTNTRYGSIHSDMIEGTAAQISECNLLAIYPVIGWWRERHNLKKYNSKARYSVIISLETPAVEIDLYTTVQNIIKTPVSIEITT